MSKILIATDGTDVSRKAVDKAISLAKETGASLTAIAVYAVKQKENPEIGEYNMNSHVAISYCKRSVSYAIDAAKAAGVNLNLIYAQGEVVDVIVSLSDQYDTIVCGTRGLTGIKKKLSRSVSEEVKMASKCQVIVAA